MTWSPVAPEVVEKIGWVLIHSAWQFLVIATLAFLVHGFLRRSSAQSRYASLLVALAVVTLMPLITWFAIPDGRQLSAMRTQTALGEEADSANQPIATGPVAVPAPPVVFETVQADPVDHEVEPSASPTSVVMSAENQIDRLQSALRPWLPVLVLVWCVGVLAFAIRPVISWLTIQRLKSVGTSPVPDQIRSLLNRTADQLGVRRTVAVFQSALVQVPIVVGYLRPAILLPASVVCGLPVSQLEAILAHELAHIQRHDYLFNLIQTLVETLFFYHPAVWWISSRIRDERENCCDDIAVALIGNRLEYGRALLAIEERRGMTPALSVSWGGSSLLERTRRLLGREANNRIPGAGAVIGLGLLLVALVSAGVWAGTQRPKDNETVREEERPDSDDSQNGANADPTPAEIADRIEAVMNRYDSVEYEVESTEIRNANAFTNNPPMAVKGHSSVSYLGDSTRWYADENSLLLNSGTKSLYNKRTISRYDGTSYWVIQDQRLTIGENELANSRHAPRTFFWHAGGHHTRLLHALRKYDVAIDRHAEVNGHDCLVLIATSPKDPEAAGNPRAQENQFRYEITLSPAQSWLPIRVAVELGGKPHAVETLEELRQSPDGDWYPGLIHFQSFAPGEFMLERSTRVTEFRVRGEFQESEFSHPTSLPVGYDIVDHRAGLVWHNDAWWPDIKPWFQKNFHWPRPNVAHLTSLGSFSDPVLNGEPAPPIEAAQWLNRDPGGWNRPDRKLTILFFFGGDAVQPTPGWIAGLKGLQQRYNATGLDIVGVASAPAKPEAVKRLLSALDLDWPVAIDAPSDRDAARPLGKTATAYRMRSYAGVFLIDAEGKVLIVDPNERVAGLKISQLEYLIRYQLLSSAERETGRPTAAQIQTADDDPRIADDAFGSVGNEWKRLRKLAPGDGRLWALLKFPGGVPPGDGKTATLTITPEFRMLSSTTPGGWFVTHDDDLPIPSDIGCDLFLLPKGTYRVTVKRPGFATLERRVTLPAVDAGKPLEFEMTPGDSITGRVVSTRGEPIENAVVKAVERHHLPHSLTQYTTAHLPREPRTTDVDGQFAFTNLYEGMYTFEITAAGFETLRVTHLPVGRQNQKIVLRTPAEEREREAAAREREDQARRAADAPESLSIVGTLVDDVTGEPVEGATIACGAFINETGGGGANAVTDAQGRFRLVPPSAGIYNVWVKKYEVDPQMTAIADDGVRVILGKPAQSHLRLVKGRRVAGRLVDPAGDPVEGSTIGCYSLAHPQSTGGVESRKTDAQGEFEFHLPPGPVRVYVMGALFRDGLTADASFEVPDEDELPTLRLKLVKVEQRFGVPDWVRRSTPGTQVLSQKKAADITGTVVDTQGKPLPGALVFRTDGPLVPTGAKGEFRVAVDKGTQLVMFAFVEGYHVWFGTPTAGDVLKIVMETKERPKRIPVKPSSTRDESSQKSQEPDDRETGPDKADKPQAEAAPGGKPGPGAKEQARNSKLKVRYNIPGVTETAAIVVECNGEPFGTESNGRTTSYGLAPGKSLELTDLPSGDCFVARNRRVELVRLSPTNFLTRDVLLDARRFQLQVNDDQTVDFSRPNGKPLKGRVLGLKESGLERALISVCSEAIRDARMAQRAGERGAGTVYDIRPCAADGTFETEPLLPGRYVVIAGGYVAPPSSENYKLSDLEPRYVAIARVEVTKTDPPEHVELRLADTRTLEHPVTVDATEISVREAMAVACERADVGLEFDREALRAVGFDGSESREIHADDRPLGEVLRELIRWNENPEVTLEFREATVTLTTHSAQAARLKARLPEWLRPLYGNGLIAQLDDSGAVISLSVNGIADDAFLEKLKRLPKLRELHIEVTKEITVEGLTHLVDLPALEKLSCYDVNAEGQGLGDAVLVAAARISTLRSLSLNHCGVTNAGLEPLLSMPELRELHLGQNLLSDPGLKYLAGLKELRTLNLNCTVGSVHYGRMQFTDVGLAHLARLSKLEDLDLTGQPISARSLVFPRLKNLSVGGSEIDDEAAAQIAKCRDLRSLSLVYSSISNDGLTAIATIPQLVQLNIDSDQIGDEGIAHLSDMKSLESLSLRSTRVGDRSLGHLAKIGSLRRLDLHGSGVPGSFTGELFTVAALKQLQALPNLQSLSIQNLRSRNGFQDLAALNRLQSLSLFMSNISADDIEFLEEQLPDTQVFAASGGGKSKLRSKKGAKPGTTVVLPADPK